MPVKPKVLIYPTDGLFYRLAGNIPTGISVGVYGRLPAPVARGRKHSAISARAPKGLTRGPWQDAINRLLRSVDRPDPNNLQKMKRWTQGDLAIAAGITGNTLSELLNEKREPSLSVLNKVALAFGVPLSTMFVTERQAAILASQQISEDALNREVDITARVEQRVMARMAEMVRQETALELEAKPVSPPAIEEEAKPTRRHGNRKHG